MRADLIAFFAPREEKVTLNGVTLTVREIAATEDTAIFRDGQDALYKFIVRGTFDEQGKRVFEDGDVEHLKGAGRLRIHPLIEAAVRVNGIGVEDEIKNSAADPSAG